MSTVVHPSESPVEGEREREIIKAQPCDKLHMQLISWGGSDRMN